MHILPKVAGNVAGAYATLTLPFPSVKMLITRGSLSKAKTSQIITTRYFVSLVLIFVSSFHA